MHKYVEVPPYVCIVVSYCCSELGPQPGPPGRPGSPAPTTPPPGEDNTVATEEDAVRTFFPETWIFAMQRTE